MEEGVISGCSIASDGLQILMQSGKASLSSSQQAGIQLVLLEQKCSNVEASQQLFRKKKKKKDKKGCEIYVIAIVMH